MAETKCKRGFQSHVMCDCEPAHPLTPREKVAEQTVGPVNYDRLRSAIHSATHAALPFAEAPMTIPFSTQERAALQAEIADLIISNLDKATAPLAALASSGDHAELARLAEAATKGPWIRSGCRRKMGDEDCIMVGPDGYLIAALPIGGRPQEHAGAFKDAAFIAAANPATVLALLAENAALRAQHEADMDEMARAGQNLQSQRLAITEAECKLAEAVGLVERSIDLMTDEYADTKAYREEVRTFLSKEAERG